MKIAMLGAGAYGTALGGILSENKYDVDYYDPIISPKSLTDVLSESEIIVSSVPSQALPELLPDLPKDTFFIVATKGLFNDQIFADFTDWGIISGPGFADDIKAKKPTYLTVTDDRIIKLFSVDYMHFDSTTDRRGVIMCGSLKNIYAILSGLKGLVPGTKIMQDFLNDAAREMQSILSINQADPATVELYCGIDDLKLTCASESRNFTFGNMIKKDPNYKPDYTVEGLSALNRIKAGEIVIPETATMLHELIRASQKWS